jgi:hypothetical protein
MATCHLILAAQSRLCAKCKASTYWVTNRQLSNGKYGLCVEHAWGVPGLDAPDGRAAYLNVLHVFGSGVRRIPDVVSAGELDEVWRVRWTWVRDCVVWTLPATLPARYVGPCGRCWRPVHRYGPRGRALCTACLEHEQLSSHKESLP